MYGLDISSMVNELVIEGHPNSITEPVVGSWLFSHGVYRHPNHCCLLYQINPHVFSSVKKIEENFRVPLQDLLKVLNVD
jgi:hypothetical protein